VVNA
jgi:hypothetical protein